MGRSLELSSPKTTVSASFGGASRRRRHHGAPRVQIFNAQLKESETFVDTLPPIPPFKDFVLDAVREQWAGQQKPLLLSRIGQLAVGRGYNLQETLSGRKLAQFIQQELGDDLELDNPGSSATLLQARPKDENAPAFGIARSEQSVPKLNRGLWLAFSRPIPDGYERRLQLEPSIRFWDQSPPLSDVAGRFPVPAQYIARPQGEMATHPRAEVVMENIHRWMRDNQVDISKFEVGAQRTIPKLSQHNPLMLLIASLDESEQKRVSLPLDVIAKLLLKK